MCPIIHVDYSYSVIFYGILIIIILMIFVMISSSNNFPPFIELIERRVDRRCGLFRWAILCPILPCIYYFKIVLSIGSTQKPSHMHRQSHPPIIYSETRGHHIFVIFYDRYAAGLRQYTSILPLSLRCFYNVHVNFEMVSLTFPRDANLMRVGNDCVS